MTSPPMEELTLEQAWKLTAVDPWAKALLQHVPAWKTPTGDSVAPYRDRTRVRSTLASTAWPAHFTGAVVDCPPGHHLAGESLRGMPMEAIPDGAKPVPVWVTSMLVGQPRLEMVPIPKKPWIEGHPHRGGAFDRHWIGVHSDGTTWELLQLTWNEFGKKTLLGGILEAFAPPGYPDGAHWDALEAGRWDPSGKLVSGTPVIAGACQLSPLLLTRDSLTNPHVLGLALSDYGKAPGSDGQLNVPFPLVGDRVAIAGPPPPGLTGDALAVWRIGESHGFRIFDRSGAKKGGGGIPVQSGAQWATSNIHTLRIPFDRLRLVTN